MMKQPAKSLKTEDTFKKKHRRGSSVESFPTQVSSNKTNGHLLQRKADCACGGGCPTCQTKHSNLPISQPTDASEIEADRVADKVMRTAENQSSINHSQAKPLSENLAPIARTKSVGEASAGSELGEIASSGSGGKMDDATENFMQNRFGMDFSNT